ncbi:MAG: acyl-CoA dehydrogenase [Solirubrobacterales bacterium]|nr:acyl-CoA dehydrogenase [Solirubrobacterales bacterium]
MHRTIYNDEHERFRILVRDFFAREVVPDYSGWEKAGCPPREFWLRAGELGILSTQVPAEYGGLGHESFKFSAIVTEEAQHAGLALGGVRVQTDICLPYFQEYTTEEQRRRWLPRLASGEAVAALAISEPGAGSDMKAMSTKAVRDGDHYLVNGAKTFISNGAGADLVVVAAKTDPSAGRHGLSLLVVDARTPGFERGRRLRKVGQKAQDLAELFFTDMRVPVANLLGEENRGFAYLTSNLAQERLSIALNSQAAAVAALRHTVEHVASRAIGSLQHTKFELAACATEVEAGQALADKAVEAHDAGILTAPDAAMVKLFCTELQGRVADRCVQLHGAHGLVRDSRMGRAYADARVSRIYGGSTEIMKVIVAKSLGL